MLEMEMCRRDGGGGGGGGPEGDGRGGHRGPIKDQVNVKGLSLK